MVGSQLPPSSGARAAKRALRGELLAARRARTPTQIAEDARACAEHVLALPEVRRAATVAAYVAVGSEPGTSDLLAGLSAQHRRVVLPVLQPDGDLDWGLHAGVGSLWPSPRGLLEPTGSPLGLEEIARADVVLVPGLAVDDAGLRMGHGGGCYDRALARVAPGTLVCVLLYPDEVGLAVPGEPHDRRVTAAATAAGVVRF